MISITVLIRKLAAGIPGIPTQWIKDLEKIRERTHEAPKKLIHEKVEDLRGKAQDRPVKRPGLFLRDLNRVVGYVDREIKDPTKHGLQQLLTALSNDVSAAARKGEYVLPKAKQTEILESADKLRDDGRLLKLIADLFAEVYEGVRNKLSDLLRGIYSATC